jgi:predicted nucleotidyltransferase
VAVSAFDDLMRRVAGDPAVIGVILTGSVARDMATEHSDHDVIVVVPEYDDAHSRTTRHSKELDEIIYDLADLADTTDPEWQWARWQFRGARLLLDRSDGRIAPLIAKQATPTAEEAEATARRVLDGYINQAYRAAKSRGDGRLVQAQLDTMECVPWLLETLFALHGRLRPYNKYLRWELETYPLGAPWDAATLPERIVADPVELFGDIERLARERGYGDDVDTWDASELDIVRRAAASA